MHTHTQDNKVQRFFWNKMEGGRVVHFGDVPFTVQEDRILDSLEIAISRAKSLRVRKMGCHAHVQYKTYTLYPEYAIREKDAVGLTKWALTTLRMQKLDQLRTALQNGHVREEHKHFVSLPTVEAHSGHATGIQAGFSQRVNPAVVAKITELVGRGIRLYNKLSNHYVSHICLYLIRISDSRTLHC